MLVLRLYDDTLKHKFQSRGANISKDKFSLFLVQVQLFLLLVADVSLGARRLRGNDRCS